MGLFKYQEVENVRVPKLNDLDGRIKTLESGGGSGGSTLRIDGGNAFNSGTPYIKIDGGSA